MDAAKYIGKKYGRLLIIEYAFYKEYGLRKVRHHYFKCRCECGVERTVLISSLVSGNTKSCGCYRKEYIKEKGLVCKHGEGRRGQQSHLYMRWKSIKTRCCNPVSKDYKWYGGRGIKICDEWAHDFSIFRAWSIKNGFKEGLVIDRIDNNGPYSPSNCRWTTCKINAQNRRSTRVFFYAGKYCTLSELAEKYVIKPTTLRRRFDVLNWSLEKALLTPIHTEKRNKALLKSLGNNKTKVT